MLSWVPSDYLNRELEDETGFGIFVLEDDASDRWA